MNLVYSNRLCCAWWNHASISMQVSVPFRLVHCNLQICWAHEYKHCDTRSFPTLWHLWRLRFGWVTFPCTLPWWWLLPCPNVWGHCNERRRALFGAFRGPTYGQQIDNQGNICYLASAIHSILVTNTSGVCFCGHIQLLHVHTCTMCMQTEVHIGHFGICNCLFTLSNALRQQHKNNNICKKCVASLAHIHADLPDTPALITCCVSNHRPNFNSNPHCTWNSNFHCRFHTNLHWLPCPATT